VNKINFISNECSQTSGTQIISSLLDYFTASATYLRGLPQSTETSKSLRKRVNKNLFLFPMSAAKLRELK
jgi:hypothetical protein